MAAVKDEGAVSLLGPGNLGETVTDAYLVEKMKGAEFQAAAALEERKLEANDVELQAARDFKKREHKREDHPQYHSDGDWIKANMWQNQHHEHEAPKLEAGDAQQNAARDSKREHDLESHTRGPDGDWVKANVMQEESRKDRKRFEKRHAAEEREAEVAAYGAWATVKKHDTKEVKEKATVRAMPQ